MWDQLAARPQQDQHGGDGARRWQPVRRQKSEPRPELPQYQHGSWEEEAGRAGHNRSTTSFLLNAGSIRACTAACTSTSALTMPLFFRTSPAAAMVAFCVSPMAEEEMSVRCSTAVATASLKRASLIRAALSAAGSRSASARACS